MDSAFSPLDPPRGILWDPVQNFSFHAPGVERTNNQDVPLSRGADNMNPTHAHALPMLSNRPLAPVAGHALNSFHGHQCSGFPLHSPLAQQALCLPLPVPAPTDTVCHVLAEPAEVKEEAVGSVPVSLCGEGVVPPVLLCGEGVVPPVSLCGEGVNAPPVTVSEEGVVNLWRAIGSAKGFSTDTDLAKFLMTLYMNHEDASPGSVRAGDLTTGRQQTDIQTVVHLSQEVGSPTDNQTDRPSSRDGKPQTDAQCSKCSHPLALVCINRQCQRSPVAAAATGTLLQAEPSGVGRVTGRSSGDEMDVEEFSGFEVESSAEDSDLDTVMSEGCPVQARLPLTISKKKAQNKKSAQAPANSLNNNLQPIVKLRKCDFPKHATQTSAHQSAKADHSAFGSQGTKDKAIKRKSNVSVESGAKAMQNNEVFNEAESRKRTTADISDEDSREKTGQADSDEESREKTGQADSDEDSRKKTGQADPATRSAESDGCPDTKRQRAPLPRDDAGKTMTSPPAISARQGTATSSRATSARRKMATSPRAKSARLSTRSSGPPEVVQPAEQLVHDLFKETSDSGERAPKRDDEWTPESAPTKDQVEKIKIGKHHKRYRSMKSYTLQEFMTGKIPVPITYNGVLNNQDRHCQENWHCSHYTCLKCYTVFEMKRVQFWKHEKGCNGIRDRDSVVTGREHQRVKDEHAALELEDEDMASEDSQSNEDVAKTAADCQLTQDPAKTAADCLLTNDLAKTTADSQLTKYLTKTTADDQLTNNLAQTTADSQLTKDLTKTTADGQLTNDLAQTTADGQLTEDLAQTTADGQLTNDQTKTAADGQLTKDGADQCQTDLPRPQPGGEDRQLDPESIEILMRVKERYLHCCPHCDIVFFNKEQQKMHSYSHFYTKESNGTYTCQLCNKKPAFQKLLYMHRHLQIPKKRNSQCEQCGLSFKFKCQMVTHTKMHLKEAARLKTVKSKALARQGVRPKRKNHVPLLCPICGRLCAVRSKLKKHMRSHSDEKPYACSVCGIALKSEKSLKAHEATHDGPQYQCEDCGKEFFNKQTMIDHRKVKHMGQVFPCEHCGKELHSKSRMKEHMKHIHLRTKSYTCSICGFGTGLKTCYQTHMRTHSGEKPFQCDTCLARFARADYLKKHVRLHTGERPYSCDDCSQRFVCASSLKHHRVRHHSDKTFPCDVCEEVLYTVASRDFHRYMAHGGAQPASVFKNKKRYPCNMCRKVLHSSTGLEFHIRKHLESDQKTSEHQESDRRSQNT